MMCLGRAERNAAEASQKRGLFRLANYLLCQYDDLTFFRTLTAKAGVKPSGNQKDR